MTLADLLALVLKGSILAIVFAIGLSATPADLVAVIRRPGLMLRSFLAMSVLMLALAVVLVKVMRLPVPVEIILISLALAPVPPLLPNKLSKAGGDAAYGVGLLVSAGLLSIAWIPLVLEALERVFDIPLGIPLARVAMLILTTILAPLAAGVLVARFLPGPAARLAPILSKVGGLLLLLAAAVLIFSAWSAMAGLLRDGTLLAVVVFILVGLAVGHLLGGPGEDNRTVLAMATASRHPGVAIAIAHLNFPNQKAVLAAALLYLIANALLSAPYVAWRKRQGAADTLSLTA